MTDPLSIVEELRHTYPASGGPCLELTAADEIERLTAYIKQWAEDAADSDAKFQELEQERDRLRDELHTALLGGHMNEAVAQIERLRAALERLRDACIESNDLVYAAIATEALGPAQGTSARIPPREFDIESHTGLYTEPAQETP